MIIMFRSYDISIRKCIMSWSQIIATKYTDIIVSQNVKIEKQYAKFILSQTQHICNVFTIRLYILLVEYSLFKHLCFAPQIFSVSRFILLESLRYFVLDLSIWWRSILVNISLRSAFFAAIKKDSKLYCQENLTYKLNTSK